jgi:hypothetical protein
MDIIK